MLRPVRLNLSRIYSSSTSQKYSFPLEERNHEIHYALMSKKIAKFCRRPYRATEETGEWMRVAARPYSLTWSNPNRSRWKCPPLRSGHRQRVILQGKLAERLTSYFLLGRSQREGGKVCRRPRCRFTREVKASELVPPLRLPLSVPYLPMLSTR